MLLRCTAHGTAGVGPQGVPHLLFRPQPLLHHTRWGWAGLGYGVGWDQLQVGGVAAAPGADSRAHSVRRGRAATKRLLCHPAAAELSEKIAFALQEMWMIDEQGYVTEDPRLVHRASAQPLFVLALPLTAKLAARRAVRWCPHGCRACPAVCL